MAEAAADTATDTTTETGEQTDTDLQAEVDKWKSLAKKHEDRSKGNAAKIRELEDAQRAQMTDTDRALSEARAAGRAEAITQFGTRVVDAELRAASSGRTFDGDALIGLDRGQFIGDDGDVDVEKLRDWVSKNSTEKTAAPEAPKGPLGPADLGQGNRQAIPIGDDNALLRGLKSAVGA